MYNPILFNDEIYLDITIENVLPIYRISNYGTVINKYTNQQISQQMTKDGYLRVGLSTSSGIIKQFLVHRLVMLTFHPIENSESLEVNHLYGIKNDNRDSKLEWTTGEENRAHAMRLGLNTNIAENHSKAVFTNNQVRIICQLLSEGKSFEEIYSAIGDTDCKSLRRSIQGILNRESWTSISKDYTFAEYRSKRDMFTPDEVHIICKNLANGTGYKEILELLGFNTSKMTSKELSNFCDIISNIRVGRYYSNISSKYNFENSKSRYDQKFSTDEIEEICKYLELGLKAPEILTNLHKSKNEVGAKEYDSLIHFISRIKNHKQFTNISGKYNF